MITCLISIDMGRLKSEVDSSLNLDFLKLLLALKWKLDHEWWGNHSIPFFE